MISAVLLLKDTPEHTDTSNNKLNNQENTDTSTQVTWATVHTTGNVDAALTESNDNSQY